MAITRADQRLGKLTQDFLRTTTPLREPRFVLLAWDAADAGPADLHIITNADDSGLHAAMDVAQAEIDDPS